MRDKPKCPGCGMEMRYIDTDERGRNHYTCQCGYAAYLVDTADDDRAAAASDKPKVLCPCGKAMQLKQMDVFNDAGRWYYECSCGWCSPLRDTPDATYSAAMKRAEAPNRVLTIDALLSLDGAKVYEECRTLAGIFPMYRVDGGFVQFSHEIDSYEYTEEDELDYNRYGATWRCWARKPTDAERAAAKWEAG